MPETKFIITKRFGVTPLFKQADGFYHDPEGTIFAFKDGVTVDKVDRCGVWPLALPMWPMFQALNDGCVPHDFAFSSPVYQAFHTFGEANQMLEAVQALGGHPIFGEFAEHIAASLGVGFWENPATK